jgi:hypothetical protein
MGVAKRGDERPKEFLLGFSDSRSEKIKLAKWKFWRFQEHGYEVGRWWALQEMGVMNNTLFI